MDLCLVKDLCLKIYLPVLNDMYTRLPKSNIASSPQNYAFSELPISGNGTNALQWSRLETLVPFAPPSPISCITFCPQMTRGSVSAISIVTLQPTPCTVAPAPSCSPTLSFPSPPSTHHPQGSQSTDSAMPVLSFGLPGFLLPRGSEPSLLSGFQHLHKSGSHRPFCLIFESPHVHVSPSVSQLLH